MYDCQTDTYTDFEPVQRAAPRPSGRLRGLLEAMPLQPAHYSALARLAAHVSALGYTSRHQGTRLRVEAVSLNDALAINAAYGHELIIRCELRQDPPVRHP